MSSIHNWFFLILLLLTQTGCETVSFYRQAVAGQWQILQARHPVQQHLDEGTLPAHTLAQLALSQDVLEFAGRRLDLPDQGRYRSYADLSREHVVWNVFAAGPYDLVGHQWCYPVVGCAPYRGYFKQAQAEAYARRMRQQGMEVYLGPVPAYSTLGWFKDPLMNTFIHWPEAHLVQLLIHELAHGKVWVKNDVALNESFAGFVGQQGTRQWFDEQHRASAWTAFQAEQQSWDRFKQLMLDAKDRLKEVYGDVDLTPAQRAGAKARVLSRVRRCYAQHKSLLGQGRLDETVDKLNNAYLVSLGTYEDWQPAMAVLFDQVDQSWPQFYAAVAQLGDLSADARQAELMRLRALSPTQQPVSQGGDDRHTKQVHCQAL